MILVPEKSPNFIGLIGYGECKTETVKDFINIDNLVGYCQGLCSDKVYISITNAIGQSFQDYLDTNVLSQNDWDAVMFQLLYALSILEEHKIMHNDMHIGNIRLDYLKKPVNLCFTINNVKYQFTTNYILYLYDWDYSYCKEVGDNLKLNPNLRDMFAISNAFVPCSDLHCVMNTLNHYNQFEKISLHMGSSLSSRVYFLDEFQLKNLKMFREYKNSFRNFQFMTRDDMNRVFGTDFFKANFDTLHACSFFKDGAQSISVDIVIKGKHPLEILQREFVSYANQPDPAGTVWCYSNDFMSIKETNDVFVKITDYSDYIRDKLLKQEEKNYIVTFGTTDLTRVTSLLCSKVFNSETSDLIKYNMFYILRLVLSRNNIRADLNGYALASYVVALILFKTDVRYTFPIAEFNIDSPTKLMKIVNDIFNQFPNLAPSPTSSQFINLHYKLNDSVKCYYHARLTLLYCEFGQFKPSEIANAVLKLDGTIQDLTPREARCLELLEPIIKTFHK